MNPHHQIGAGVAALIVLAGTAGGLVLLDRDPVHHRTLGQTEVITVGAPTPGPERTPGLAIGVHVEPDGPHTVRIGYRVHGMSGTWSDPATGELLDFAGPAYTEVKLDGESVGGSDGGPIECRRGAPTLPYDGAWQEEGGEGFAYPVPGPGTYTVTVEAPYCGTDGKVVQRQESVSVTVPEAS